MYEVRVITMIVFCFFCFRCPAACSALLPTSVTLNASQTHSYARHAYKFLRGRTVEDRCMCTGAIWVHFFVIFTALLYCCLFFFLLFCTCFVCFIVVKLCRALYVLHFHWFNISHEMRAAAGLFPLLSLCVDVLLV
ncbi:mucin-associated surface protein (MASP) [Trypanosoma cruzi]|nr:mucin-associated surface protein (MASP) [Trypanosoma cruzi]